MPCSLQAFSATLRAVYTLFPRHDKLFLHTFNWAKQHVFVIFPVYKQLVRPFLRRRSNYVGCDKVSSGWAFWTYYTFSSMLFSQTDLFRNKWTSELFAWGYIFKVCNQGNNCKVIQTSIFRWHLLIFIGINILFYFQVKLLYKKQNHLDIW